MTFISRIISGQLKIGKSFCFLNHKKYILPTKWQLIRGRNFKLFHHYKENLLKRKPKKKAILLFLVGHTRYTEAVESLSETALKLYKLLIRQCEVHIGIKIKNCLYFYCLYSRIWGEEVTRKMLAGLRKTLIIRTRHILGSALPLSVIDLSKCAVPDGKLDDAVQEYTTVPELVSSTLHCKNCDKRKIVDTEIQNVDYCKCNGMLNYTDSSCAYESWEPFLERKNTIVWRKFNEQFPNMYSYKIYGKYDDISASSFAEVQLNTCNRTKWDSTALELSVIGSDPSTNTDLLYWKIKFPKFFADRDYVYKRRFRVNENRKEIIIVSEAIEHDGRPKISGIHRIEDYWAVMVIRADDDFHLPGMSYSLTYFDNPGTALPTAILNFIASKNFPDFLSNVHKAAYLLQTKWNNGEDIYLTLPEILRYRRKIVNNVKNISECSDDKSLPSCTFKVNEAERDNLVNVFKEKLKEIISSTDEIQEAKIPISFRKAVVDLLEAAEIIGPNLNRETLLAKRVHEFVEKFHSEERSVLLEKALQLALKTTNILKECAAKKENSLKEMRELEKRKVHYKHQDESAQQFLSKFFFTLNKTMQTDKDLRTGKLLFMSAKTKDELKTQSSYNEQKLKTNNVCSDYEKLLDKSVTINSSKDDLNVEECSDDSCNTNNYNQYYNIWSSTLTSIQESHSQDLHLMVNTDRELENRNYSWCSYPIIGSWKFVIWLTSSWSS